METVLLCDDDRRLLDLFGRILTAAGYRVLTAADGEEAVRVSLREKPDLVLMDIAMPVMDGLKATSRIKAADPDVVIIALTSHALPDEVQRGLDAGCDGYILKPEDPQDLPRQIRLCLAEDV